PPFSMGSKDYTGWGVFRQRGVAQPAAIRTHPVTRPQSHSEVCLVKKGHLFLAIAVGLVAGLITRYGCVRSVHAEPQAQPAKELRAQSFVFVNERGDVRAVFALDESNPARPVVRLFDSNGRELWSAGGNPARPLSSSVIPK